MALTFKTREVRERVRRKYAARSARIAMRSPRERRLNLQRAKIQQMERGQQQRPERRPLRAPERQLLLSIHQEKDPDLLKEKINQAQKAGIEAALMAEDVKRLEKQQKARERIIETARKMRHREASANEKEAAEKIRAGKSEEAMKDLARSGRDGAIGNEIAESEHELSENMKVLKQESGRHFDSLMQKALKENSVPADSMNQAPKKDKSDQNLEEKKVNLNDSEKNESTQYQMTMHEIRKRRGAGLG